jgi:hypothetical protein
MPYINDIGFAPYYCPNHDKWYRPSGTSCAVMHSAGDCCHQYEAEVKPPKVEE